MLLLDCATSSTNAYYQELEPFCLAGLRRAWNRASGLFDQQLRNAQWSGTQGTEDITSTCIALIGLNRAGIDPVVLGIDVDHAWEALLRRVRDHRYAGAVGLALWANAVNDRLPLGALLARVQALAPDLTRLGPTLTTMEAAWLASGWLHEHVRCPSESTRSMAIATLSCLAERFSNSGRLMRHATAAAALGPRLRGNVANFADQIYSLQACAFAGLALPDAPPRWGVELAERLTELQGPRGEWYWHYDAARGRVAQRYPIYSVHQYGMAPMALAAARCAGFGDFTEQAARSRGWLRDNELQVDMVDPTQATMWRDIDRQEPRLTKLARHARTLAGSAPRSDANIRLQINRETRPYEWAWCLYAGAIEADLPHGLHLV